MNWTFSRLRHRRQGLFGTFSDSKSLSFYPSRWRSICTFFHAFNQIADISADRNSSFHEPLSTEVQLKDDITS